MRRSEPLPDDVRAGLGNLLQQNVPGACDDSDFNLPRVKTLNHKPVRLIEGRRRMTVGRVENRSIARHDDRWSRQVPDQIVVDALLHAIGDDPEDLAVEIRQEGAVTRGFASPCQPPHAPRPTLSAGHWRVERHNGFCESSSAQRQGDEASNRFSRQQKFLAWECAVDRLAETLGHVYDRRRFDGRGPTVSGKLHKKDVGHVLEPLRPCRKTRGRAAGAVDHHDGWPTADDPVWDRIERDARTALDPVEWNELTQVDPLPTAKVPSLAGRPSRVSQERLKREHLANLNKMSTTESRAGAMRLCRPSWAGPVGGIVG